MAAAKKQVLESEGVANGNRSVLNGGVGTAQGVAAMRLLLDGAIAAKHDVACNATPAGATTQHDVRFVNGDKPASCHCI